MRAFLDGHPNGVTLLLALGLLVMLGLILLSNRFED